MVASKEKVYDITMNINTTMKGYATKKHMHVDVIAQPPFLLFIQWWNEQPNRTVSHLLPCAWLDMVSTTGKAGFVWKELLTHNKHTLQ